MGFPLLVSQLLDTGAPLFHREEGRGLSRSTGTHRAAAAAPLGLLLSVSFLAALLLVPDISALLLNIYLWKVGSYLLPVTRVQRDFQIPLFLSL